MFTEEDMAKVADELYESELKEFSDEDSEIYKMLSQATYALECLEEVFAPDGMKMENLNFDDVKDSKHEIKFSADGIHFMGVEIGLLSLLGFGLNLLDKKVNDDSRTTDIIACENAKDSLCAKWFDTLMDKKMFNGYKNTNTPKYYSKNKKNNKKLMH